MRIPQQEKPHKVGTGTHRIYRFPNGYGASVIRFEVARGVGSYGVDQGKWELAVIKFGGESLDDFNLVYDTPISDDVLGYLSEDEVDIILSQIEAL